MRNVVHLKHKDGRIESLKCKDGQRAKEIADKRPSVISYQFYSHSRNIPRPKKKRKAEKRLTIEEMERMISKL